MGMLLIGALVIGGILWFVVRLFRSRSAATNNPNGTPNFLPNRPTGPTGGNYGQAPNSGGGMGLGGMLATGAAAAAGAYLGNRMASGHDTSGNSMTNGGGNAGNNLGGAGAAGGAAAAGAGSDYFNSRDSSGADNPAPDYFSDANTAPDNSSDFFSSDDNNPSYDDTSSGDTGGGGFDSTSDNSGSW